MLEGIRGAYRFRFCKSICERYDLEPKILIPNIVVLEGKQAFLQAVVQNADMGLAGTPPLFYIGLCDQVPAAADTLASITTEPTSDGGYARASVERSAVGWPTIDEVNGVKRAQTQIITFAASGAAYSGPISRAFLCSVSSGATGTLFSYSGALSVPIQLQDGESFDMQYELYFN